MEYKPNIRKLWKLINELLAKLTRKGSDIECLKVDGSLKYDPDSITNAFCSHFSSVGESYSKKIKKSERDIDDYISTIPPNENSIFFSPTSEIEIKTLINELIPKNSSSHDNISKKLLKQLLPALL